MASAPTTMRRLTHRTPAEGSLPAPVRRRRPVLMAAAVLLGALVWLVVTAGLERASERVQVWSVATEVSRGQAVEQAHLTATEIAVPDTSSLLPVTDARVGELAGGVWAADLPAGTLLSPGLVLERLDVSAGEALVGVALQPGGWPSPSLRAGDTVMVVRTSDPSGVMVERATVDGVTLLGDAVSATRLITLTIPQADATDVATAAASGDVVLVVVP